MKQSTNHLLMVEPADFYANPETMETNVYQVEKPGREEPDVYKKALQEFRDFRDLLVQNGVHVTTVRGKPECPDMVFPNWASTHRGGRLVLYPMLNDNRRAERSPGIIALLKKTYPHVLDLRVHEQDGLCLEARGSLVCDRVNRIAYVALSKRTTKIMAEKWADHMEYKLEIFETQSHTGKPVYHTDLVAYVGTGMIGVVSACIKQEYREKVLTRMRARHDVLEFDMDQLKTFCGNALEVACAEGKKMLVMSSAAYHSLSDSQMSVIEKHFAKIVHSPLPTLEKYGGGSARCMLMELY